MSNRYHIFKDQYFVGAVITGALLLASSLVINYYAGAYAVRSISNPVTDLILNNIPVYDVDALFVFGPIALWTLVGILCLYSPNKMPFIFKSIALFILIRSLFITLTHIGPFPDHIVIDYTSRFVKEFTLGGDLFFSGHTGLPFLMALLYWDNRFWRIFFIIASIFFGAVVLLAHLHYSIDVLAAYFITYTIFHLSEIIFPRDREVFGWN